ncbi:MAG: response regulator transcription factor [Bacteroidia bacterium]|nr:response regulator transcription factor [Bacteroidia bacterium]
MVKEIGTDTVDLVIAEGNFLVRQGLQAIFKEEDGFSIVGETENYDQMLEMVSVRKPDVLIIGINLQSESIITYIQQVRILHPEVKILVIDIKEEVSEIVSILKVGVQGYILKQCDKGEIMDAMRAILRGSNFFCHNVMKLNKTLSERTVTLTQRELQVLNLISEGLTNKEIADRIFLSDHTVASHRKNLMKKFEATNNVDLVIKAIKERIIFP